ncbi:hypothetical protein DNTS_018998, partial [Danionella cerebrum]
MCMCACIRSTSAQLCALPLLQSASLARDGSDQPRSRSPLAGTLKCPHASASRVRSMDESSLLDLLECSVCLERLDASARVLPCQHTFCRRCLESIVRSRRELRCPECRVLVGCAVDALPANILLVRLLDGIKQRPRGGGSAPGSEASSPVTAAREMTVATRSSPVKNVPQPQCGKALLSSEAQETGDQKHSWGEVIILRRRGGEDHWSHGELKGSHTPLPASSHSPLPSCPRPVPQTPPAWGKALYDFQISDSETDTDCLTFSKDEILTVIRRVDDNWAEGKLGDKIGIFPILYVELNESAKKLIETDKPVPSPSSSPGPSTDPGSPSSGTENGSGTPGVHRCLVEGKKNTKKRHSFTALSMTQRTLLGNNNRHSMEISSPVLISASDPRAAARITDGTHLSCSAPDTHLCSCSTPDTQGSSVSSTPGSSVSPRVSTAAGEKLIAAKVQLPLNIYLALYAYRPQKADELELCKGEMYRVLEKCQDGWFKGTSLRSGASGVFPGNYVTPVSRAPFSLGQSRSSLKAPGSPVSGGSSPVLNPSASSPSTSLSSPASPLASPLASASVSSSSRCVTPLSSPSSPQIKSLRCLGSSVPPERSHRAQFSPSRSPVRILQASPLLQLTALDSKLDDKKMMDKKEKRSSGLLKLLSGAAAKKKPPRSPPSSSSPPLPSDPSSSYASSVSVPGP